jgi:hypothetical protein
MLMVADQFRLNAEMATEFHRLARVFSRNQIDFS